MLLNELKKKEQMLNLLIGRIKSKQTKVGGHIRTSRKNGKVYFMYTGPDGKERYLRTDENEIAREIFQEEYNTKILNSAQRQLAAAQRIIHLLESEDLCDIYSKTHDSRRQLITPFIDPTDDFIRKWLAKPYEGKGFAEGDPVFIGPKGERMRSKSECLIADLLIRLGIPYRYEYPINVKGYGLIYADFLVLNVRTREEFILEHFGMLDKPEYTDSMCRKLNTFAGGGIFPGRNLMISCESSTRPININALEKMLTEFCLSEG